MKVSYHQPIASDVEFEARGEFFSIHLEIANSGDRVSTATEYRVHGSEPVLGFQLETALLCRF